MVLSVIGTQCVGKSTFIKDLIEKYNNFETPETDYRKLITEKNLQINRNGNYRSQKILFDFILDQTIQCVNNPSRTYILDRSIIDVYAYSMWLYDNIDKHITGFTYDNLKDMEYLVFDNIYLYDKLLYIPLEKNDHVEVVDDKFRDTDLVYRENIDNNFNSILELLDEKARVIEIYGAREDRIKQFEKVYFKNFI